MLWVPLSRKTRSGAEFSGLPRNLSVLQEHTFDYAPLVARAVQREGDDQEDHDDEDHDDNLDGVDDEWPPPDPLNTVDDESPPPPHDPWNDIDEVERNPLKRRATFDDVVTASGKKPHAGPHRRRAATPTKPHRPTASAAASRARRKAKRERNAAASGHVPTASTLSDHVAHATPLESDFDTSTLPTTNGAYAAKVASHLENRGSKVRRSLLDFIALGFTVVRWDGIFISTPRPIVDHSGRIIAVLAGQPDTPSYRDATALAFAAIRAAGNNTHFPTDMKKHRRGLFAAINVGLSYGKGQTKPGWLNNKEYTSLAESLLANVGIQRMAGFGDAAFALWAPRLYKYYQTHDVGLRERHPELRRPFKASIFFCVAFNFGRNVWTFKHRDVLNLAFGMCIVRALGDYDATLGGHLALWDLKLLIEFPHGAAILLPSATIAHSNVPVRPHEERVSFAEFSAGGIFRYVDNGCQTVKELAESDPEEYERLSALMAGRWEEGLSLLSTVDELLESK
ncbi:hypothetical protein C8R46DRAFT_1043563 [Mycena filopes]|nr:hypothetical protein C8R46DRAFT_1043563 [Mycena filopes]